MIDGGLRKLFHANLPQFHWQAVETGAIASGVPDSNACFEGCEFWTEFKLTSTNAITFQPEQVGWLMRRTRAGGRTFVAVRFQHNGGPRKGAPVDALFLYKGSSSKRLLLEGLRVTPIGRWEGGPSRGWDWCEIGRFLRGASN